ncbi:MAG: SDR family NAD(P)-dependent oxidoreductase [Bryobacteraceae bacterium]|nr:SDR family NAD(P)-dependent oxidoreductase [Bryobacteraceae bacterium]
MSGQAPRKGTAAITGASSGIGAVFARRLAKNGYNLLLIARRVERLEELRQELEATGIQVEVLCADLATDAGLLAVGERIAAVANLELLINNAGFGIEGPFFASRLEEHDRMHRLHVLATVHLCHAALQRMEPHGTGTIINVSSVAGFQASAASVSYAATKCWMNNFTEGLWLDLKTRGSRIRIQALCPGFTISEFHDVMAMDRTKIPSGWWTSADYVVDVSLAALQSGELFVIPGWRYKALIWLSRVLPAAVTRYGTVWFARNFRNSPGISK